MKEEASEHNCYQCGNFSELKEPKPVEYGNFIYGYCFGNWPANSKGYAVYIPDGGSRCKEFEPNRKYDHGEGRSKID